METNNNYEVAKDITPKHNLPKKIKQEAAPVQTGIESSTNVPILQSEKERGRIKMEKERERLSVMVKGVFKNHETPGAPLKFSYKEFPKQPRRKYKFEDGQVYETTLGVAEHLNNRCAYPVHAHALDEYGRPSAKIGQMIKRFGFYPIGFGADFNTGPSNLVSVEYQPAVSRVGY